MTIDHAYKAATYTVIGLMFAALAFCLFSLAGCSSLWQSVKSAAAPGAGGAAGAAVGSLAGPAGTIAGAGIGAIVGDQVEENAALRSGEIQGEGARNMEEKRWKGLTASEWSDRAYAAADAEAWLSKILKWVVVGVVGWLFWRNRHNIRDRGLVKGLAHGLWGGRSKDAPVVIP